MTKKDVKPEQKTLSSTEKAYEQFKDEPREMRRGEFEDPGALYIEDQYKEDGYVYRVVNANPRRIREVEHKGYSIVREDVQIGADTVNKPSHLGSAVEIPVSNTDPNAKGVLMRVSVEDHARNRALKDKEAYELKELMGKTDIPTQYGTVEIKKS
jgi:hypothetical protein